MALPAPNLDDRTFQDLVNEARRRIPLHCPEWTDHNLSDPGITLIELFAWMTEMLIYRLNKVPDKNYTKFLELLGLRLTPANPATTEVSFRLTAPPTSPVTIPSGTEVATVRTETRDAIVFTTDEDLVIAPSRLEYLLLSHDGSRFDDRLSVLREWEEGDSAGEGPRDFQLFQGVPEPGNAFYLGFGTNLRGGTLSVTLDCEEAAAPGINPADPPLAWEYWDASLYDWAPFERTPGSEAWLAEDGTRALNRLGQIVFHIPRIAGETTVAMRDAFWIRCTVVPWTQEQGSYEASPRLKGVRSETIGGSVIAGNAVRVVGELIGTSNGKPGQSISLDRVPVLPLGPGEVVEVQAEDGSGWESWEQVDNFALSGPEDKHFVCDPVVGEIQFGPAIRSPNGAEVRHGAIPPQGSQIRLTSYRHGGGPSGNVGRDTLTVLKSSIPYVASVTNPRAATGGVDPEDIENAKLRGPQILRTRNRAVAAEDFEYLAREASPSVRRARCIQPRENGQEGGPLPGVVQVYLVPTVAEAGRRVTPEELVLSRELLAEVREYLDDRRLLTTALAVSEPDYMWLSVRTRVKARQRSDPNRVREAVEQRLYRFIHPLTGGAEGDGWPFGRGLFASELYSQIQAVDGVEYVESLEVSIVDPVSGEEGEATQTVEVPPSGVLCSHTHSVTCV